MFGLEWPLGGDFLVLPVIFNAYGLAMGGSVLGNYVAPVLVLCSGLLFRFMIIYSADRKLYAGEERYYAMNGDVHDGFASYWQPGATYFEVVNAADFDDISVPEADPKTPVMQKLKWALGIGSGTPEPKPAYPRYRRNLKTGEVVKIFNQS